MGLDYRKENLSFACDVVICSKSTFDACKVHRCLATLDWLCSLQGPLTSVVKVTYQRQRKCQATAVSSQSLNTQFSRGDANIESSLMILPAVLLKSQHIIIK